MAITLESNKPTTSYTGCAWIERNGSLSIQMKMITKNFVDQSFVTYAPSHPKYKDARAQVGFILPGQRKALHFWNFGYACA
jgi:hypothetical protein